MLFDTLVTMGSLQLNPAWLGLDYNWLGKAFCVLAALVFACLGPLRREEIGLCAPTRWRGSFLWVLLGLVCVGVMFIPDMQVGRESFLYELTMPGMAEELTYRGILLAFVLRAYGDDAKGRWLAAIVTSVAFACIHDIDFQSMHLVCPLGPFAFHFAAGMFLAWVRLATGSLLMPVLAHNIYDTSTEVGGLWQLYFSRSG